MLRCEPGPAGRATACFDDCVEHGAVAARASQFLGASKSARAIAEHLVREVVGTKVVSLVLHEAALLTAWTLLGPSRSMAIELDDGNLPMESVVVRQIQEKYMSSQSALDRLELRRAIDKMPSIINADFCAGHVRSEADLQFSVVRHLRSSLPTTGEGRWLIGGNHTLHGVRPDVACYRIDGDFGEFTAKPEESLVGVIEIKFASDPTADLDKMTRFQARANALAWIVYGDHYSEAIHRANYRAQRRREAAIVQWKGRRQDRGYYIMKTSVLETDAAFVGHRETVKRFNANFWNRDAQSRTA